MTTETEFRMLKVLWSLKSATVSQVRERYNAEHEASLAYTTVMTLLGRLAAKGAVKVDKEREPYLYTSTSRRQTVLRERVKAFVNSVFDGDADELVLQLVEGEQLSPEVVQRLRSAIDGQKKGAKG